MSNFYGRLELSQSGWLLLRVPNFLALGAFRASTEPGLELPRSGDRPFMAHIAVMRPEEVQEIGGPSKITERGKSFAYRLTGQADREAKSNDMVYSRYWFIQVASPELAALRRSYGLSPEPSVPFHITYAARKRNVLQYNNVTKAAMLMLSNQSLSGGEHVVVEGDS